MRSHGHKPDIFGNIKAGFKKKEPVPVADKSKKAKK
jgi:YidC/Oxa1 family membrane protein insertase